MKPNRFNIMLGGFSNAKLDAIFCANGCAAYDINTHGIYFIIYLAITYKRHEYMYNHSRDPASNPESDLKIMFTDSSGAKIP